MAHMNFADPLQAANFMKNLAMAGGFTDVIRLVQFADELCQLGIDAKTSQ